MSQETERAEEKPAHLDRLSPLWRRVADHKIAQWSVAYVALAYGVQHAIILTGESFEWPNAVARVSMLLLALGLPLVVTFAWYHGARASRNFSQAELSILATLLAIGSLFFYVMVRPSEQAAAPSVQQASVAAARSAAADPHSAISVAVLPFVNLSSDKEQEFFSDGMTEEITTALAKVPDLRVVGRTSAFQFKGANKDLRAIGQALSATHLIEGSVRKAGTRVRITAQLIKADDGTHIWAEDYDRELTDVFAIQEDIARAITASLNMSLGLKSGEQLISNRAIDPESYEQFLRGKAALFRARNAFADQIALLEPVVAKNPNYAPAWVAMAQAYRFASLYRGLPSAEERKRQQEFYEQKMNMAARRAVELDPNLVDGKVMLARIQTGPRKLILSEDLLSAALILDPNNPAALDYYSSLLALVGKIKDAVSMKQQVHVLEPYAGIYSGNFAQALWQDGQTDAAIALSKENLNVEGAGTNITLAYIYASFGRYEDAAALADQALTLPRNQPFREQITEFARLMRSAPAKAAAPEKLPRLGNLSFVYLFIGAPERALEPMEEGAQTFNDLSLLWTPPYKPVRTMERFKKIIRDAGLITYWRERGWPQWCHPTTGDDFACE
jgi:TolB-like protein